ncbi:MAG: S8 family serine peptidase [Candidatus Cloacimonetes bacterium]|nr:S8 family serine peptidase [Candidatus Cloacimonadota bacterium]
MKKNYLFCIIVLLLVIPGLLFSEKNNDRKLLELSRELHEKYTKQKEEALKVAKEKGWPVRVDKKGEYLKELMGIEKNGMPIYNITDNINSARTIETDELWSGGGTGLNLSGNGFLIGEWDGGLVRTTHQEFDDGVGGSRVTQRDAGATHWHSTHVGGTLIAEGQNNAAHGMAFEADLDSYDWDDDLAEMADAVVNDDLILSNHSYGRVRGWNFDSDSGVWSWYGDTSINANEDYKFGFYGELAEDWDNLAYNSSEYLIVKSAGNDRDDNHVGWHWAWNGVDWDWTNDPRNPDGNYDCIGNRGVAKNLLTVGSCLEIPGGYTAPGDVVCSDFSGWGPCDDGRIKPDIVANGDDLYSTDDDNDTDYTWSGGTSMSSPAVAGSCALLQEHYENLNSSYMLAATLKGLVIQTADEAGPNDGPDYMFGWGLMNSETATDLITYDNTVQNGCIYENNLANGATKEYYFYCDGTEDIKATICWTDPAGTPVAAALDPNDQMLVNDLDMRIIKTAGSTYYPWSCDPLNPANAATNAGDNDVDNVEQIFIDNPAAGYYTLQISHKGNIGTGQDYSLIFSGMDRTYINTWTGNFNHYWGNAGNWTLGHIPTATEDVEIPNVNMPCIVDYSDKTCHDILVYAGAAVQIYDQTLDVTDDATVQGSFELLVTDARLNIADNIVWESGSTGSMTGWATIDVKGNWNFESGANVQFVGGVVEFSGTSTSWLRSYEDNCQIFRLKSSKTNSSVRVSDLSTQDLNIMGNIYNYVGSTFRSLSSHSVILGGFFNSMGGNIECTAGTFVFNGNPSAVGLKPNTGDYFNNLTINTGSYTLSLDNTYSSTLTVNGNLLIESGTFDPDNNTVEIGGNWTNNVGDAGFIEGSGRVIFNGSNGHQYCSNETFNILEIDKPSAAFRLNGTTVSCASYDWTSGALDVLSGTFTADNLANNGLYGSYYVNPGGTINLHQDTDQWIDLEGSLTFTNGGTINVYGGSLDSYWAYSNDASITMNGGTLDFVDQGIYLYDHGHTLTSNISGGTIRTSEGFTGDITNFNPTGGTIECYGTTDGNMNMGAGSNFHNIHINKIAVLRNEDLRNKEIKSQYFEVVERDGSITRVERSNTITATTNLDINGDVLIENGLFVAPTEIRVAGNWTNNVGSAGFTEGTGIVIFDKSSGLQYLYGETFYNVAHEFTAPGSNFQISGSTTVLNNYTTNWHCYINDVVSINNTLNIDDGNARFTLNGGGIATVENLDQGGTLVANSGIFTANDLVDNGIFGTIYVYSGELNLHQDGGQYVDLNADVNISGGTFNIYGGSSTSYWGYTNDISFTMSDGIIDFKDNGVFLSSNHTITEDITGGVIRTSLHFTGNRSDFNPTGGTIVLYGTTDANISHGSGSNFFDVRIDKESVAILGKSNKNDSFIDFDRTGREIRHTRANTINVTNDLHLDGDLYIDSGTFNLNGHTVEVGSDANIYGTLQMNNALDYLVVNEDVNWYSGSSDNVDAGKIFLGADWLFENGTNAQLSSGNSVYFLGSVSTLISCMDADAEFGDVLIDKPAMAAWIHTSSTHDMHVTGFMTVSAGDIFQIQSEVLLVEGILDIEDTAEMYTGSSGSLTNNSDFTLNGLLDVDSGDALIHGEFELAATGILTIDGGSFISDAPYTRDRAWQYLRGELNLSDGIFEITDNSIQITSTFVDHISGGIIRTGRTFYANELNTFQPSGGSLEFTSNASLHYVNCANGNYLHNMLFNGSFEFDMHSDIIIQNDLEINTGVLDTNGHNIDIAGNWTNNVGTAGFDERTQTVTFFGGDFSDITTNETFYNLTLDKTSTNYLKFMDNVTINVINDLNINDGVVEMDTGSTLNIGNDLDIALDAGLNAYLDTGLNIIIGGNWTNNNVAYDTWTGFYPGTSTVTFNGSTYQYLTTNCAQEDFYDLVIDKGAGEFKPNENLQVYGDLNANNGTWSDNVMNLVHTFYSDVNFQSGSAFHSHLADNTVIFAGSADQTFYYNGTGGYFYNVTVDKSPVVIANNFTEKISSNDELVLSNRDRSQTLTLDSYLNAENGDLIIEEGILDLNGNVAGTTGNITINDGGTLIVKSLAYAQAILKVGDSHSLTVNSGGVLQVDGVSNHKAVITRFSIYDNYDFNVESGGTIFADNGDFCLMSANGVYIKNGAIVDGTDSFNNCSFALGVAGGTLLRIDNDQTFTADNVCFVTNTWSGASNVMKSVDSGEVTFTNAYCGYAGPNYEDDPFNRLHWSGFNPDLEITNVVWSDADPYLCDEITVSITLYNIGNVDIPAGDGFCLDLYYNQGSPPVPFQIGDQYDYFSSGIPSGSFVIIEFDIIANTAEFWNSYVQADTDDDILELNESNNIWGPDVITWNALPVINDLTIQKNAGNFDLNWTYPITVDYYNIYKSSDPFDFSGATVVTSPTNSYSEAALGTMLFYQVTAVRNCTPTLIIRDEVSEGKRRKK